MSQINQLMYQYLDDRESLSEEEMERLVATLRRRPGLAKQIKDQLIVEELLGQSFAIDRKNFIAQVEQRIRDLDQPLPLDQQSTFSQTASQTPTVQELVPEGETCRLELTPPETDHNSEPADQHLPEPVTSEDFETEIETLEEFEDGSEAEIEARPEFREHAKRRIQQWHQGNRKRRFRKWAVVMLCTFVIGCGVGYWSVKVAPHVGEITSLEGTYTITRQAASVTLSVNDAVVEGDELTTTDGTIAVRYADGTIVTVSPHSQVRFQKRKLDWFPLISAKQVNVISGRVSANVAPQWSRFPMQFGSSTATAIVHGTELTFQVASDFARLNVIRGTVELKRASDATSVMVRDQQVGFASLDRLDVADASWPTSTDGLLFHFETGNKLSMTTTMNGESRAVQLMSRSDADFDSLGRLDVRQGSFVVENVADLLLEACQQTNELTLETTFQTASLNQTGPARLITFGEDSNHRNFTLGQRDRQMILRLMTDQGTPWKEIALFELPDLEPHHLIVSYRHGELIAWLDGKRVFETSQVRGRFAEWKPFPLVIGDDFGQSKPWVGILEGVAVYHRFFSENEAQENALRYQQLRNHRQQ